MSNTGRGKVSEIKPHTPYRKSIVQDTTSVPGKVRYLHATKGWRTTRIVQVSMLPFWQCIVRAQVHHAKQQKLATA